MSVKPAFYPKTLQYNIYDAEIFVQKRKLTHSSIPDSH